MKAEVAKDRASRDRPRGVRENLRGKRDEEEAVVGENHVVLWLHRAVGCVAVCFVPSVMVAKDDHLAELALRDRAHDFHVFVGKISNKDGHVWLQGVESSGVKGGGVLVVDVAHNGDAHRC